MTLVVPVDHGHVIHSLRLAGDPELMAVTYGVQVDSAFVLTPNLIADDAANAFINNILPRMSAEVELVQTEVQVRATPAPDPLLIGVNTDSDVGGEAGAIVPQNTAYLVHKRTSVGGRGGRGRLYLPGVPEADVNNVGALSSVDLAAWAPNLTSFLADLRASGSIEDMVVLHDSAGTTAADPPAVVTSLTMDPVVSTQRRRLRR